MLNRTLSSLPKKDSSTKSITPAFNLNPGKKSFFSIQVSDKKKALRLIDNEAIIANYYQIYGALQIIFIVSAVLSLNYLEKGST